MNEGKFLDRAESSNLAGLGKGMYTRQHLQIHICISNVQLGEERVIVANQIDLICNTYTCTRGDIYIYMYFS